MGKANQEKTALEKIRMKLGIIFQVSFFPASLKE